MNFVGQECSLLMGLRVSSEARLVKEEFRSIAAGLRGRRVYWLNLGQSMVGVSYDAAGDQGPVESWMR